VDGKTLFSETQSRAMWTPQIAFTVSRQAERNNPSVHFRGYGLGWSLSDYLGRAISDHGGAADGMFSHVTIVPEEHLGFVILTNSNSNISSALHSAILDAFLGGPSRDWSKEMLQSAKAGAQALAERQKRDAAARKTGTKPSLELADYTGTYGGDLYGNATVAVENGGLVLRLLPNPDFVADLTHYQYDTFTLKWRKAFPWFADGKVQFLMNQDAKVTEMKVDVPNDDFWFNELEFKRIK
jgi:hypothetical protein